MNIAIIGASGFVGKNLTQYLLSNTNHHIFAISREINQTPIDLEYKDRLTFVKADILNSLDINKALDGIDIAYYLVHMMANNKNDFYQKEILAAEITSQALKSNKVKRIIYLSGLGKDNDKLSLHLLSRHKTGNILRQYNQEVIEFRASMIIGEGSISFEIVKNLVEKSPIITLPKWAKTKTEPIGISDALLYLKSAIDVPIENSQIIEIGGRDIMSYEEFVKKYAQYRKKKVIIIRIPILSEKIAGLFLDIFNTKEQSKVGRRMLESFKNEMIVTNNKARELFPDIKPRKIEEFFNR